MQFGTSAFNAVVCWRKLGEVENKCTLHNFSLFAISLPKIIKIGGNMTKFWQKQFCTDFIETRCIYKFQRQISKICWSYAPNSHFGQKLQWSSPYPNIDPLFWKHCNGFVFADCHRFDIEKGTAAVDCHGMSDAYSLGDSLFGLVFRSV